MQRGMDLVRKILLTIEAQDSALLIIDDLVVTNYHDDMVSEHIRLMAQAGLIDVFEREFMDDTSKIALSWFGHEFLDNARNDTTWNKAKAIAGKVGSTSFAVFVHVLTGVIDAQLKAAGIP